METLIQLYASANNLTEEWEITCTMTGFRTRYYIHTDFVTARESLEYLGAF